MDWNDEEGMDSNRPISKGGMLTLAVLGIIVSAWVIFELAVLVGGLGG